LAKLKRCCDSRHFTHRTRPLGQSAAKAG
jgi:hypothetical protein